MTHTLRTLLYCLIVKPFAFFMLGINIDYPERLPKKGPAIIVANHNSHLDTVIIMSLFPVKMLKKLRPVAAADYFLKNRFIAWFSMRLVGILPISRKRSEEEPDPLASISQALLNDDIIIFYPEGTRGEPNQLAKFKSGIAYLASKHPNVPIHPLYLAGTAKALPRGTSLLVPFVIGVKVLEPIYFSGEVTEFTANLENIFIEHAQEEMKEDL